LEPDRSGKKPSEPEGIAPGQDPGGGDLAGEPDGDEGADDFGIEEEVNEIEEEAAAKEGLAGDARPDALGDCNQNARENQKCGVWQHDRLLLVSRDRARQGGARL